MKNGKSHVKTIQQTQVDNLSHDGRGIARIAGKTTFIQGALPQEEVEFQYLRVKKDYDEGRITQVIKASPHRVTPRCAHYAMCGGCSFQHVDEKEQIHIKQGILIELLQRVGHTSPLEILPPLKSKVWNYRNKARLSVRFVEKKQQAMVGFRERNNPRYITDIHQCPVLHEKVDKDINALKALIDSMDDKQCIAQIEVAAADREVALIFRNLSPLNQVDSDRIKHFGETHHYRIYLQPGGEDSVYCFYPENEESLLSYNLPAYDLTLYFHPTDFTQVNAELNRLMVDQALALLDLQPEDEVLDLFCGLGNFSLPIAKLCAKVIGVEGSFRMVERARSNAKANQLNNTEFHSANLDSVEELEPILKHRVSKMLIDPPRSGALELVKQIERLNPSHIVYVSCNPITLARDADILVNQKGYTLEKAGVMDMFPHTSHVESIALFVKKRN